MSALQFRRRFIAGVILCLLLALLIGRSTSFQPRWRGLKDGMTQAQVRRALGSPSAVGTSGCIGWDGKNVLRWDYRRFFPTGVMHYYVDFDYIGAGGAPVVFRTERFREEWRLPWRAILF
jgi:hypothetical protein